MRDEVDVFDILLPGEEERLKVNAQRAISGHRIGVTLRQVRYQRGRKEAGQGCR
jgi:hypothetical protein